MKILGDGRSSRIGRNDAYTNVGDTILMLVTARLKYVADSEWGSRRYLDVSLLDE